MKKQVIRHGDLALVKIGKLPKGLIADKGREIMKGSQGKPHLVENGKVYFKKVDQFIFGYLEAEKGCKLMHQEHGKKVEGKKLREFSLPVGVYELRNQVEFTQKGMKLVVD
jgi:hypothetical protein